MPTYMYIYKGKRRGKEEEKKKKIVNNTEAWLTL